jgi:hypothetical protein
VHIKAPVNHRFLLIAFGHPGHGFLTKLSLLADALLQTLSAYNRVYVVKFYGTEAEQK